MQLIHYSQKEIDKLDNKKYLNIEDHKPKGLWFSVKGEFDWEWWCKEEKFRIESLKYEYEIIIKSNSNILYLQTGEDIDLFTLQYKSSDYFSGIKWQDVVKEFDGIIIAPYQWSRRLEHHTFWYYGWDCASGCIWNLDVIDGFKLVKE